MTLQYRWYLENADLDVGRTLSAFRDQTQIQQQAQVFRLP